MNDTIHVSRHTDAHYSPDDGGWYSACYFDGCGWIGKLHHLSGDARREGIQHQLNHWDQS